MYDYCWLSGRGCTLTGILVSGVLLLVVNSGSPSIVEQSQQRHWLSCISLLSSSLWLYIVVVVSLPSNLFGHSSALLQLSLSAVLGFCIHFYSVPFCNAPWDSLSGLMHSGIACLASQAPDWAVAFWDGLSGL